MKDQTDASALGAKRQKPYRRVAAVPEVQSITETAPAHSVEMHGRMVKYATAMGIRIVCLGLIFVFDGWFKLIPVIGAVILPWIAVVIANGGADTSNLGTDTLLDQAPVAEIETGTVFTDDAEQEPSETLIGEYVVEDGESDETWSNGPTDTHGVPR